jgi:hypothetical protein
VNRRRLELLLASLADGDPAEWPTRLCVGVAEALSVTGVGLMLTADGEHKGTLAASDATVDVVEDLQFGLGEGPSIDAYQRGGPVLEPNLDLATRWPAFTRAALEAGVLAVFAFPMQLGAARIGALTLYRDVPGFLDRDELAEALVLADVATLAVLNLQAGTPLDSLPSALRELSEHRTHVYQAMGMISVQLESSLTEALARLRAHAFAEGRSIGAVASDVVARRLHFEPGATGDVRRRE